jgi:Zn finger protein HypA/HybF involved in hydrogenase expression
MTNDPGAWGATATTPPGRELGQTELVWRCADCGYQRQASRRLPRCPGCGAGADRIEGKTSIEWRVFFRTRPAV